jgi:hypothetical protein
MAKAQSPRKTGARVGPRDTSDSTTIHAYTIRDQESFDAVTGPGHELAGLYTWAELDILIDLARLVSLDFFARPEYYKEFEDPGVAEMLAQLHARYGCEERILSHDQRQAIFTPLFYDAAGDFVRDRDALLSAAATFAEWGQSTGVPMLREAVRTTHENFLGQLTLFTGRSIAWSRLRALPFLANEVCYPILRERGVTAVFGVSDPPRQAWPYQEDANGDQVVEEISRRLIPNGMPPLTRHGFRLQQRAALRGAEAIAAALDFDPTADDTVIDLLITRCYTWYAALQGTTGMGRVNMPPLNADGDRRQIGAGSFLPR